MKRTFLRIKGKNQSALLIILLLVNIIMIGVVTASPGLNITVSTDKEYYYIRQRVIVSGKLTYDGQNVSEGLVGLQIDDPNDSPILFRTLSTPYNPTKDWKIKIVDVIPCDINLNPKNQFKLGSWFYVNVIGRNDDTHECDIVLTISLCDGNQNPIGVRTTKGTVAPGTFGMIPQIEIPTWAYIGNATVYVNVYTDYPKQKGWPWRPETSATFQIISVKSSYNSAWRETQQTNGSYSTAFRIPPEALIGEYTAYVCAVDFGTPPSKSTSFEVKSASYPPTASFFWSPPEPYVNQTVTFDATASTPDGGTIVSYEWDFGDGNTTKAVKFRDVEKYVDSSYPEGQYNIGEPIYEDINQTETNNTVDPGDLRLTPVGSYPADSTVQPGDTDVGDTLAWFYQDGHRENILENNKYDYGETIILDVRYETYKYIASGTYPVTLNVTDSEGSWATTSKPIKILPPTGPTAKFGWVPTKPQVNETVTFDASSSRRGWNGTGWADIVSYTWNFGDGNTTTVSIPTIIHKYAINDTFTVSLNITDTQGLWGFNSSTIEVITKYLPPWDINGDGIVDIVDIVIVALAYESAAVDDPQTPWDETERWNPAADMNGDGFIDIVDLVTVAIHYEEEY